MLERLRFRALQALARQANRFVAPKVLEHGERDLYARIYLERMSAHLAAVFSGRDDLRILDAGCGAGRLCIALAEAGHRVTGIDYHAASIEAARRGAQAAGVTLDLVQGDLLPKLQELPSEGFDAVITTEVLYTCVDHREILAQLVRVLAPGGLLLASFATRFYLITTLLRQQQYDKAVFVAEHDEGVLQLAKLPTYYNWKSPSDVVACVAGLGLELLDLTPIGSFSGHGSDGMAALVDVGALTDPAAVESLYRLETAGLEDTRGAGRYLLAAARKPGSTP